MCRRLYVRLGSIHHIAAKASITSFLETACFSGYMAIFCLGLGSLCGHLDDLSYPDLVRSHRNKECD